MKIEELMTRCPVTCRPDEILSEAVQKMQGANCAFLPVTDGAGSRCLVGMITDGDIRMAAELRGRSLEEIRVKDAMARNLCVCNPGDSVFEAEEVMEEAGINRLPVVDESGQLLGVLFLSDVAREAERKRDLLCAQISAAQFGLAVSRIHEPRRTPTRTQMARPAQLLQSSSEREAAAG